MAVNDQFFEDTTLERELRAAMRTEEEIDLFKILRDNLQIKDELANSTAVKYMLSGMWAQVEDFFDLICQADCLAGMTITDKVVQKHLLMRANFDAVARINQSFKESRLAEDRLVADDLDRQDIEDET